MGKKLLLVFAFLLIIGGGALFAVTLAVNGWDFTKIGAESYKTNTHEITEGFGSISYVGSTADVSFVPSADGTCRVVCTEHEKRLHSVKVEDGVLKITENSTEKWYDYIGVSFVSTKITVYLPAGEYGDLRIKLSTGDVAVPTDFSFGEVDVETSTGDVSFGAEKTKGRKIRVSTGEVTLNDTVANSVDVKTSTGEVKMKSIVSLGNITVNVSSGDCELSGIACKDLLIEGSTSDVDLEGAVASGKIAITTSTGEVELELSDASEIEIKTSTGEVEGTLLSPKIFVIDTSTGDVDVPESTSGGKCKITTGTGDINIKIAK